jgi:tetratricopeptide (TPR) repeat protein
VTSRSRTAAWRAVAALSLVAVLSLAGCSFGKSASSKANDTLAQGLAAHQAGKLTLAAKAYNDVLKVDSRNKFAYYNLGLIYQTQGNSAGAESNYRLALSVDPNFGPALFNLAIVRKALGDLNGAIALYQQDIRADPKNAGAHLNLGLALQEDGQRVSGAAEIAKAIQLDPKLGSRVPKGTSGVSRGSGASGG